MIGYTAITGPEQVEVVAAGWGLIPQEASSGFPIPFYKLIIFVQYPYLYYKDVVKMYLRFSSLPGAKRMLVSLRVV